MPQIHRRRLTAGALALAGALATVTAQAHDGGPFGMPYPGGHGYAGGPGWPSPPPAPWMRDGVPYDWLGPWSCATDPADILERRLDLDRKQRRTIEDLLDAAYDDFRDIGEAMRDNRRRIDREIRREDADPSAIDRLAKKQGELLTRMIQRRATLERRILAELDDEQKDRYARLRHRIRPGLMMACR